jgi:hypothetical protein
MSNVTTDINNLANELKQWTIGVGQSGPVLPMSSWKENSDRAYNLNNSHAGFAQWVDVSIGFNWGYRSGPARRFFFVGGEPIRYGETIAIGLGTPPSFLHHTHRTVGPDLEYAKSAAKEWKILGGKAGDPVLTGDQVALYNEGYKECLIYFKREVGANVGVPTSKTLVEQASGALKELGEDAVKKAVMAVLAG